MMNKNQPATPKAVSQAEKITLCNYFSSASPATAAFSSSR